MGGATIRLPLPRVQPTRRDIEVEMAERGVTTGHGARAVALATRPNKEDDLPNDVLRRQWRDRADSLGFDTKAIPTVERSTKLNTTDDQLASAVTEHDAAYPRRDVIRHAARSDNGASLDAILRRSDDSLAAPLMDQELLAPAFGCVIVDQVILRHGHNGQPLDTELLLLLDETANVPLVQLPNWASTVAGYGVQLVTVWQSKAQIDAAYGPSADTVIAGYLTQLYFPGIRDLSTIRYVTELLGTKKGRVGHAGVAVLDATWGARRGDRNGSLGQYGRPWNVVRRVRCGPT